MLRYFQALVFDELIDVNEKTEFKNPVFINIFSISRLNQY